MVKVMLGFTSALLPAVKLIQFLLISVCRISNSPFLPFQTLFGSKPAGFGTTTTSAPSFGTTTGGGLFGNKPTLTLGTNTNTSNFGTYKKKWDSITLKHTAYTTYLAAEYRMLNDYEFRIVR